MMAVVLALLAIAAFLGFVALAGDDVETSCYLYQQEMY